MIEIYTDGSCIGNPGPGGWGVIILEENKRSSIKGGESMTTNNRMEMKAIIAALHWLQKNKITQKIRINSDSNLLVQTMNLGWKRKANLDLWKMIDERVAGLNIEWKWVKAHATNKHNNDVDKLAFCEAQKFAMANRK